MKHISKYIDYINYLALFVLGCVFILIFSNVASPLTEDYSADSSIFMAMGKMFLNGKVPYVEFFDHKGPSMILLQSLGQIFMPYRPGIFLLEVVNLFLVLLVVYKTSRLLVSRLSSVTTCLVFLVFISRFFNMGNTTEELSFLPLFITLYYTCKLIFKKELITPKVAFIMGLSFSFLFWLRINNAGVIVATCVFFFFLYLIEKDYKSLGTLILYFVIGQLPFTVLYCGYFWLNDGMYEMVYATFLFNFMYVDSLFNFQSQHTWVNYAMLILLIGGNIVYYLKEKNFKILAYSSILFVITLLSMNIGPAYNHYFLLACPVIVLGTILILYSSKHHLIQVILLVGTFVLLSIVFCIRYTHLKIADAKARIDYAESYKDFNYLLDQIPEKEKSRAYFYEVVTSIYPLLKIDTNYKYFVFQEWHGKVDPNIFKEIRETMTNVALRPQWVILQRYGDIETNLDRYKNVDFVDIIKQDYQLYDDRGPYILYKLKNQ